MLISEEEFQLKYSMEEFEEFKRQVFYYVNNTDILKYELKKNSKKDLYSLTVPKPDEYLYYSTRYKALSENEKKLKNFFIAMKQSRQETIKDFLPTVLDIEPVSRCNFRCIMCQLSGWNNGQRADDMVFDDYKKLIDSQYGLTEIKLQGVGEPLMHQNFFEMIKYAREKNIWVRTTINGSLLGNGNYKKLIDSDINDIQISFDGATKEVFERIRRNSNFEQIKNNVKMLNEYARSLDKNITNMWVLLQQFNKHQIIDFVIMAKEMKFSKMTFSIGMGNWGQEIWENANSKKIAKDAFTKDIKNQLMELKVLYEIDITLWDLQDKFYAHDVSKLCPWPFSRVFIGSDMKMSPCCMIANPDVSYLGDGRDLVSNWNSKLMVDFRKRHLMGEIPDYCKNCYSG